MAYQIAAASSDGKVVNQHFGRATKFLIFEVEDGRYKYAKTIETVPFCNHGEHDSNELLSAAEALIGCRAVLVSQVGSGAAAALKGNKIEVFSVHDFIEDALDKLIKNYTKIDGGK